MRIVRVGLLVIGVLAVIAGLIWVGQGTGWFPYPASSFMIADRSWAWRGGIAALAGLIAIVVSRRI